MRGGLILRAAALMGAATALLASGATSAPGQDLPLPPGTVVVGEVFRGPTSCNPPASVSQITNGAEANDYICNTGPTRSFVDGDAAAMVVTSEYTQYVRVYCPECSPQAFAPGGFIVDPGTIRGLTAAQIKDVLALPYLPR